MHPFSHLTIRFTLYILAIALFFPQSTSAYTVPEREYWRAYTLHLINLSRAEHNLPLLGIREDLNELSQTHAQDTAIHFDDTSAQTRRETYLVHISSDRRTLEGRVREHAIEGATGFGENVGFRWSIPSTNTNAVVETAIRTIHEGMMAEVPPDDGHRKTILGDYTHVGVGLELQRKAGSNINTLFFVSNFGKFHQYAEKSIPELGPSPLRIMKEPIYQEPDTIIIDKKRQRVNSTSIDVKSRKGTEAKMKNDVHVVITEKNIEQFPKVTSKVTSWVARNQERVEGRRSERLAQLLSQVEERRQRRMENRGIAM